MFDAINLDGLTIDHKELSKVADVLGTLETYARVKATAMREREAGRIEAALGAEAWCERLYKKLPEWARW